MEVTKKVFARKNNQTITSYTLKNDQGFQMSCIDYGCIITEIITPDQNGKMENVVLGFDTLEEYESNPYFLGALVGRFAGRIKEGAFVIGGADYQIARNANGHHLHGGSQGFHSALWDSKVIKSKNEAIVEFTYFSPDGEEGFPGNLFMTVRYLLKNDSNQLIISYSGKSDKTTLLNVTNHSYFNLSGNFKRTTLDHVLTMKSDHYLELDEELLPTGNLVNVDDDLLFDFRNGRSIKEATASEHPQTKLAGNGYDHPFLLNRTEQPTIELTDPESGRKLLIETTEPAVVLYTGNDIGGSYSIRGVEARDYLGLCLETQSPPGSVHHPHFPSAILNAEEEFKSETTYSFS
ncbi:aldose epimerase family protein [Planococcus shenhongbingii]|uniref:aldose epimerase family protein n=1 Tax=Planococcus shenhongbingii TaxID=3058398 RepID=UPI002621F10A|nr:aldose epimerase family protein [Planococcus sp. N016]WKA60338.1 aldose epimerase family protein [Planococcus sp. N016]